MSMTHNLYHLIPNLCKNVQSQDLVPRQRRGSNSAEKPKREVFFLYGIEVSTSYGTNEGMVATYGFVSTTNHDGKMIMARRKEFLT